jgi:hypothetical protein
MTQMARPASVRVFIHEHDVQSFIRPGGPVRDVINNIARDARLEASLILARGTYGSRNGSHNRSNRLTGGNNWNRAKDTGPLTATSEFYNNTKHVWYFMEGTTGPIRAKGPWGYLLVPRSPSAAQRSPASKGAGSELYAAWKGRNKKGRKGFYQAKKVAGQKAKPFMEDALRNSMMKNGFPPR